MEIKVVWLIGIVLLMTFAMTVILVPFSIKLAHKIGAIDIPKDERRVHTRPVPRIGGVAIFLSVTLSAVIASFSGLLHPGAIVRKTGVATLDWNLDIFLNGQLHPIIGVVLGGIIIFAVGFIDDVWDMNAKVKLLGQIVAASFVYAAGVRIEFVSKLFGDGVTDLSAVICYLGTVIWIVAITNTINLVDGLDGLAAGVVGIASLCIAYVGYIFGYYLGVFPMIALAGAALGFLIYNFYPAKTFMGDCGSQYLGFMLASFSILGTVKSATVVAVLIPGLALCLPIVDTLMAIVRRAANKQSIFAADKEHIHHRLLKTGMGQRRTVICLYGICGVMGTASVLLSRELYVETLGLLAVALLYIYVVFTNANEKGPKLKKK